METIKKLNNIKTNFKSVYDIEIKDHEIVLNLNKVECILNDNNIAYSNSQWSVEKITIKTEYTIETIVGKNDDWQKKNEAGDYIMVTKRYKNDIQLFNEIVATIQSYENTTLETYTKIQSLKEKHQKTYDELEEEKISIKKLIKEKTKQQLESLADGEELMPEFLIEAGEEE